MIVPIISFAVFIYFFFVQLSLFQYTDMALSNKGVKRITIEYNRSACSHKLSNKIHTLVNCSSLKTTILQMILSSDIYLQFFIPYSLKKIIHTSWFSIFQSSAETFELKPSLVEVFDLSL
jgi:hypothetical protein